LTSINPLLAPGWFAGYMELRHRTVNVGDIETLNSRAIRADLDGVFERADRRTGFVGRGLPNENIDDRIPERSPASMGFKSSYADTFPSEDSVTIEEGPFAGGTTQQVSRIEVDIDAWYEEDHADRVEKMFSTGHDPSDVGEVGDLLGSSSEISRAVADRTMSDASDRGRVGHAQKVARARRDTDFTPRILRRGDFSAPDEAGSVLHFGSIQRFTEDFVETRRAMDDITFDADVPDDEAPDVPPEANGILSFIDVTNRATFLVPPRDLRSFPPAKPNA